MFSVKKCAEDLFYKVRKEIVETANMMPKNRVPEDEGIYYSSIGKLVVVNYCEGRGLRRGWPLYCAWIVWFFSIGKRTYMLNYVGLPVEMWLFLFGLVGVAYFCNNNTAEAMCEIAVVISFFAFVLATSKRKRKILREYAVSVLDAADDTRGDLID